jgi:hypothetical protein
MKFKISEISRNRLLVFLFILFCVNFFESCREDITGIKQAEFDFTPMWPQVGYDGRHSSNPFSAETYIQPVSQGIVNWIDTLGENNSQSNIINCADSKGNIYVLGAHINGPLYKFRDDGSLIWKKDSVSGGYTNGVSLSSDETKLFFSGKDELCCYDSSGDRSWVYSGVINPVKPAVGKDNNIFFVNNGKVTTVDKNGNFRWQAGSVSNFGSLTLDREENIYAASELNVTKINSSGIQQWIFDSSSFSPALIDGYNNIYFISRPVSACCLISLNKDGKFRWLNDRVTDWPVHAIGKNNIIYTTAGQYIYALDTGGIELWKSLILPVAPEYIEPYLVLDSEDNIYYLTQTGSYSTTASMDKNGNIRWYVNTVIDPIHGGPVISPVGKLIFQPKYLDVLVCIK